MNRKLLIKILELLEETYPQIYHAGKLTRILRVSLDGEFFKIIRYLYSKRFVIISDLEIALDCEISITSDGINFLNELKLIETREKLNRWIVIATSIIAISTVVNVILFALK